MSVKVLKSSRSCHCRRGWVETTGLALAILSMFRLSFFFRLRGETSPRLKKPFGWGAKCLEVGKKKSICLNLTFLQFVLWTQDPQVESLPWIYSTQWSAADLEGSVCTGWDNLKVEVRASCCWNMSIPAAVPSENTAVCVTTLNSPRAPNSLLVVKPFCNVLSVFFFVQRCTKSTRARPQRPVFSQHRH